MNGAPLTAGHPMAVAFRARARAALGGSTPPMSVIAGDGFGLVVRVNAMEPWRFQPGAGPLRAFNDTGRKLWDDVGAIGRAVVADLGGMDDVMAQLAGPYLMEAPAPAVDAPSVGKAA